MAKLPEIKFIDCGPDDEMTKLKMTADTATKLKLMHVPGANSKQGDHAFVHSQLGYSYLTIFINDTNTTDTSEAKNNNDTISSYSNNNSDTK